MVPLPTGIMWSLRIYWFPKQEFVHSHPGYVRSSNSNPGISFHPPVLWGRWPRDAPHNLHLENALLAARNRKHILVVKPIARTIEEGEEMIQVAQDF